MKKIIALAVASAFAVPAFAADVTVSGDVEYMYTDSNDVQEFDSGDQDVVVKASEELNNGWSATVSLEMDGSEDGLASDSELTLSNGMISFTVGDATDAAIELFDEKSDTAEKGGTSGEADVSTTHSARIHVAVGNGFELAASTGSKKATFDDSDELVTQSLEVTSIAGQYSAMGFSIAYGTADQEDKESNISALSVSYATGPFYVGYEAIDNVGYDEDVEQKNIGASYNYGQGKLFVESGEVEDANDANAAVETIAVGASYKFGGAVNLYVVSNNIEYSNALLEDDSQTIIGVEYSF